jgi:hypothetical protein
VFARAFAFTLARLCLFPPPCLVRVLARRIFLLPPAFARPVSKVTPKILIMLRSPAKADRQVSVRCPSRLKISVAAANLVFNPDNSWDTAEITSHPNTPVVVEHPQPETRSLTRKNLYVELLVFSVQLMNRPFSA